MRAQRGAQRTLLIGICTLALYNVASCSKADDVTSEEGAGAGASGDGDPSGGGNARGSGGNQVGESTGGAGGAAGGAENTGGSSGSSEPIVIASGQNEPTGIALSETHVYWSNRGDGEIVRCPLSGCGDVPPEVVVSGIFRPMGVSVTETDIYWIDMVEESATRGKEFKVCPLPDCAGGPTVLGEITFGGDWGDVEVAGDTLYFGSAPEHGSCSVNGCLEDGFTSFVRGPSTSVTVDGDQLYTSRWGWNVIQRCTLPDCDDPTTVVDASRPIGLAVDASSIYFGTTNVTMGGAGGEMSAPGIYRCDKSGCDVSAATLVPKADSLPYAIAVNSDRIFYTDPESGDVISLPIPAL